MSTGKGCFHVSVNLGLWLRKTTAVTVAAGWYRALLCYILCHQCDGISAAHYVFVTRKLVSILSLFWYVHQFHHCTSTSSGTGVLGGDHVASTSSLHPCILYTQKSSSQWLSHLCHKFTVLNPISMQVGQWYCVCLCKTQVDSVFKFNLLFLSQPLCPRWPT